MALSLDLPLRVAPVEDFFSFHNFRPGKTLLDRTSQPAALPDSELENTDVFMAHGFLVPEGESRAWGSEFFKRLWQEGSRARFHSVTWPSDSRPDYSYVLNMSYEHNVNHAFPAAQAHANRVNAFKTANGSQVVAMAHSLGNMFTSVAITDHGMAADKYFAFDGAVPAEAYDASMADVSTCRHLPPASR